LLHRERRSTSLTNSARHATSLRIDQSSNILTGCKVEVAIMLLLEGEDTTTKEEAKAREPTSLTTRDNHMPRDK
jgi:hypothetical protein